MQRKEVRQDDKHKCYRDPKFARPNEHGREIGPPVRKHAVRNLEFYLSMPSSSPFPANAKREKKKKVLRLSLLGFPCSSIFGFPCSSIFGTPRSPLRAHLSSALRAHSSSVLFPFLVYTPSSPILGTLFSPILCTPCSSILGTPCSPIRGTPFSSIIYSVLIHHYTPIAIISPQFLLHARVFVLILF